MILCQISYENISCNTSSNSQGLLYSFSTILHQWSFLVYIGFCWAQMTFDLLRNQFTHLQSTFKIWFESKLSILSYHIHKVFRLKCNKRTLFSSLTLMQATFGIRIRVYDSERHIHNANTHTSIHTSSPSHRFIVPSAWKWLSGIEVHHIVLS